MAKEIIMGIDFAYLMRLGFESGYLYDEQCIRRLIQRCAGAGIQTIYWRVSATGAVTYQSKVRTVIGASTPHMEGFKLSSAENLIVRQCDPPSIAVSEARKFGLTIFGYMTLFDEYYPGLESEFEVMHPEYTWKHRLRDHHIRGLLSYSYPEVREHRLAEVEELLSYGFDGIYLDTARSHCAVQPIVAMPLTGGDPYLEYGFNEPEVEEFKQRYGVDPTLVNPADAGLVTFDRAMWNQLRGEYLTQFLREVRAKTKAAKTELAVGFYTDADCYLSPAGRRGRVPMGMFYHDYETWVQDDLADAFVIIAEHRRYGARDWREHTAAQFADVQAKGKKVYIWAATERRIDEMESPPAKLPIAVMDDRKTFLQALEQAIHTCMTESADGIYLYEAYDPEKFDYWKELGHILAASKQ